jgi:hypothetical protein
MKMYGGVVVQLHTFLNRFTAWKPPPPPVPSEKEAGVPRADLNTVEKINICSPVWHRSQIRRLFSL